MCHSLVFIENQVCIFDVTSDEDCSVNVHRFGIFVELYSRIMSKIGTPLPPHRLRAQQVGNSLSNTCMCIILNIRDIEIMKYFPRVLTSYWEVCVES